VDLNAPVEGVLKIMGRQLHLEGIDVTLNLSPVLPPILAHQNRLEQVLFNLISNARDAIFKEIESTGIKDGHVIALTTFTQDARVGGLITDTGTGIPSSLQGKIFEPFFTTKDVGKGMGLGLSIIYGIIKDYGGDISVQSRKGRGTCFQFSFPRFNSPL